MANIGDIVATNIRDSLSSFLYYLYHCYSIFLSLLSIQIFYIQMHHNKTFGQSRIVFVYRCPFSEMFYRNFFTQIFHKYTDILVIYHSIYFPIEDRCPICSYFINWIWYLRSLAEFFLVYLFMKILKRNIFTQGH